MEILPTDIETIKPYYYSIQNSQLTSASSVSDAQVIEVDLFQKNLDSLPIYYPKPYNSTMNIFVGGGENRPQILQAQYFHQEVSRLPEDPPRSFSSISQANRVLSD